MQYERTSSPCICRHMRGLHYSYNAKIKIEDNSEAVAVRCVDMLYHLFYGNINIAIVNFLPMFVYL